MNGKITKDSIIKDVLVNFPQKAKDIATILSDVGVACVGCCASSFESLEEGLKGHGKTDKEIEEIVNKINDVISKDS